MELVGLTQNKLLETKEQDITTISLDNLNILNEDNTYLHYQITMYDLFLQDIINNTRKS